jgi:phosphatidylinositol-3,4,5-trisphosphate 3-phosphatase/dual-specificity protein phosphatase PTEN
MCVGMGGEGIFVSAYFEVYVHCFEHLYHSMICLYPLIHTCTHTQSFEGLYRNNVRDVQRFFFERHSAHYKVYNLCSERSYDNKKFHLVCHDFKFDDHNPCPLEMIPGLCEDVTKFLSSSESNVVAIHCKAGKGRTGLMIACLLLHTKEAATAQEALECFANKRTANGKGVTIPSQIRYVHYYEQCLASLSSGHRLTEKTELVITGLRMTHAIAWSYSGESDPYYVVQRNHNKSKYSYLRQHGDLGVKKLTKKEPYRDLRIHCLVTNDFKMVFYDRDVISADDKMFWCWLNADMLVSVCMYMYVCVCVCVSVCSGAG